MSRPTGVGATALAIAYARARESERDDRLFDDPWAAQLSGPGPDQLTRDRYIRPALLHWVAMRTRFLDDFVLGAGCPQLVILGAGLDTRALRLDLPDTRVYEVDTPEVLGYKESVLRAHARAAPVPADLTGDWTGKLRAAGFDPRSPSAWVAEGLLAYLQAGQVDTLLAEIGELAAPGSRFAATIMPAGALRRPADAAVDGTDASELTAESVRSMWQWAAPEDPVAWLAGHGWRAETHNLGEVSARYGRPIDAEQGTRRNLITAAR